MGGRTGVGPAEIVSEKHKDMGLVSCVRQRNPSEAKEGHHNSYCWCHDGGGVSQKSCRVSNFPQRKFATYFFCWIPALFFFLVNFRFRGFVLDGLL